MAQACAWSRKNAELCQQPNAAIVHVRTLEILDAMGAVDAFLKIGFPFPGMHVHAFGKRIGFIATGGLASPYPCPRTLGQQFTVRLLNDHFEKLGGSVERQVEATSFQQDGEGVRVRLLHHARQERDELAAARYVVGCEGSPSIVRKTLGIDFPGERYHGKEFLQVDANVRWSFPHGFGYQFVNDEETLLFFAYNTTGHYRIIYVRDDRDPNDSKPPTLDEMQAYVRRIADPAAELYDPVWFNHFRSGHRMAATFREGRAFLAGDAGHVHVPIGGQGMNYGMHDAFNLGWKLAAAAKGDAPPSLLDSYMAERHPVDEKLIHATDRAYHLVVEPHALKSVVTKVVGPALLHTEAFQKVVRETLAEMHVSYPDSPLTEDHGGSHGPLPGERAPDATVVRMPARDTARLFDVLRAPSWTLLLFAGTQQDEDTIRKLERLSEPLAARYGARVAVHLVLCETPPAAIATTGLLMDRERYLHDAYGATAACLYLIRPDWHVGFRGLPDNAPQLQAYLERVLTK